MTTTHTQAARAALKSLDDAVPFHTTFLSHAPGCEAVGQGTPLAKAIERAMEQAFRNWEQSWIRPKLEEIIAADSELLEALKATTAILQGWEGTLTQRAGDCVPAAITAATAAIAKAEQL